MGLRAQQSAWRAGGRAGGRCNSRSRWTS